MELESGNTEFAEFDVSQPLPASDISGFMGDQSSLARTGRLLGK